MVGSRTRVKVVKNKCAPPFKQAEFDIMYGTGISREGLLLDVAVDLGFVKKSGAWFTYEGEQLGQGRENVKTFLSESPQLMAEIDERVRQHLAPKEPEATEVADADDLPISLDSPSPPPSRRSPRERMNYLRIRAASGGHLHPQAELRASGNRIRRRRAPVHRGPVTRRRGELRAGTRCPAPRRRSPWTGGAHR